jgi:hypothetical protein
MRHSATLQPHSHRAVRQDFLNLASEQIAILCV